MWERKSVSCNLYTCRIVDVVHVQRNCNAMGQAKCVIFSANGHFDDCSVFTLCQIGYLCGHFDVSCDDIQPIKIMALQNHEWHATLSRTNIIGSRKCTDLERDFSKSFWNLIEKKKSTVHRDNEITVFFFGAENSPPFDDQFMCGNVVDGDRHTLYVTLLDVWRQTILYLAVPCRLTCLLQRVNSTISWQSIKSSHYFIHYCVCS